MNVIIACGDKYGEVDRGLSKTLDESHDVKVTCVDTLDRVLVRIGNCESFDRMVIQESAFQSSDGTFYNPSVVLNNFKSKLPSHIASQIEWVFVVKSDEVASAIDGEMCMDDPSKVAILCISRPTLTFFRECALEDILRLHDKPQIFDADSYNTEQMAREQGGMETGFPQSADPYGNPNTEQLNTSELFGDDNTEYGEYNSGIENQYNYTSESEFNYPSSTLPDSHNDTSSRPSSASTWVNPNPVEPSIDTGGWNTDPVDPVGDSGADPVDNDFFGMLGDTGDTGGGSDGGSDGDLYGGWGGDHGILGGEPDTMRGDRDTMGGDHGILGGEPDTSYNTPDTMGNDPYSYNNTPDTPYTEPDTPYTEPDTHYTDPYAPQQPDDADDFMNDFNNESPTDAVYPSSQQSPEQSEQPAAFDPYADFYGSNANQSDDSDPDDSSGASMNPNQQVNPNDIYSQFSDNYYNAPEEEEGVSYILPGSEDTPSETQMQPDNAPQESQKPKGRLAGLLKPKRQAQQPQATANNNGSIQQRNGYTEINVDSTEQVSANNTVNRPRLSNKQVQATLNSFASRGTSIAVTGCHGSGVSTVAFNLANTLCNSGYTILLVDLDTRNKAQSYMCNECFASMDPESSPVMAAVNSSKSGVDAYYSIVRDGFHLLTMGMASDSKEPNEIFHKERIARFVNQAKSTHNFIIYDLPIDYAITTLEDVLYNCDDIVITVDTSNWGITKLMLTMCNIESDDMTHTLFNRGKLLFNKNSNKMDKVFGKKASNVNTMLRLMDIKVQALVGEALDVHFSNMKVCGALPYDTSYEQHWYNTAQYSDTKQGMAKYMELVQSILLNR